MSKNHVLVGTKYKPGVIPSAPFDVILIGSGIGCLSTASILAKEGKKVLVLEQHYTAGGFTHAYKRKGYEWDVGIHYIGEVHRENSALRKIFDYITNSQLRWAPMEDVYDRMIFGNDHYDFVSGATRWKEKLIAYFPQERKAIEQYLDLVFQVHQSSRAYFAEKALPPFLAKIVHPLMSSKFNKLSKQTTKQVLSGLTQNQKLLGVLSGQWGDYGMPPSQSSFAIQAMIAKHYLNGAAYPVGGASSLANCILPVIQSAGGEVFVNARVEEILVYRGNAVGVRLEDGTEINAPMVVSGVGVYNTVARLLPQTIAQETGLEKKLQNVQPSASHVCLYIGIKRSAKELGLRQTNFWIYPDYDHDQNIENYLANPSAPLPLVYISFPSTKDPEWEKRYPNQSTIEIVSFAPYEWFQKWEHSQWNQRGKEYQQYKEHYTERMLAHLYLHVPQVKGQIDYHELSTPLSTKHFANYQFGEIYGIDHTPERFAQKWLRPQTPIHNLYLTGQDIVTDGIGGALFSGVLTASAITSKNLLNRIMKE